MKKNYILRDVVSVSAIFCIVACSTIFYGYSTGITGRTLKPGGDAGCTCHAPTQQPSVTVSINGPSQVLPNSQNTYTITIQGGPLTRAGTNIAVSGGTLQIVSSDLQLMGDELTHTAPKLPVSGVVTFQFKYTAPADLGEQTIYANGNSVNFNGGNDENDLWNFAPSKTVNVVSVLPVELASFTAQVSGNTVNLNWNTATELNNKGFEIQRLTNGNMDWETVAFVKGKGNSSTNNNYSFEDKNLAVGKYSYRLKQIDIEGASEIYNLKNEVEVLSPSVFVLEQNYPNPFNPTTNISYSLNEPGNVSLKLYNALGVETAVLINSYSNTGKYNYILNASGLASGVYYYKMVVSDVNGAAKYSVTKKLMLIK